MNILSFSTLLSIVLLNFFANNSMKNLQQNTSDTLYVKTLKYEGIIFYNNYPKNIKGDENIRWNPTLNDVDKAEILLQDFFRKQIKNKNLKNQGFGNCPLIHEHLDKYLRQYRGICNNKGDKIIVINCFWRDNRDTLGNWKENWITVFDGCSYYWSIKINLSKSKCFEFNVNGIG